MNLIVKHHPLIEGARKDYTLTNEKYDPDNIDHYSEWAWAIALREFKIGEQITKDQLNNALETAKLQQTLDGLVDRGYAEVVWDTDNGEPAYRMTEAGKRYVEKHTP